MARRFNWNRMPANNLPTNVEHPRRVRVSTPSVAAKLPLTIGGSAFATVFCGITGRPLHRTLKR